MYVVAAVRTEMDHSLAPAIQSDAKEMRHGIGHAQDMPERPFGRMCHTAAHRAPNGRKKGKRTHQLRAACPAAAGRAGVPYDQYDVDLYMGNLCAAKGGMNSGEIAAYLLEQAQVVLVPGNAYGEKEQPFVRVSLATAAEDLVRAADRLEAALR